MFRDDANIHDAYGVLTDEELDRYLVIAARVGSAPLHLVTPIERDACERARAHDVLVSNLSQAEWDADEQYKARSEEAKALLDTDQLCLERGAGRAGSIR